MFESIVQYGAEMWPMTKAMRDKIRTTKIDFVGRISQEMQIESLYNHIIRHLENCTLKWYELVDRMLEER